jgi:hypothetical protein
MVYAKCIDHWVPIFVVSNTTANSQWDNRISLDFRGLSELQNPRKLEPHD